MPLLRVVDLSKSYGEIPAVQGVSFHIEAGEIFGLLGPNGAGKSTTMMMLAGLLTPDAGEMFLDEQPYQSRYLAQRRFLGVVPQDLAVYPDLSARQNLKFFGSLYGLRGSALTEAIEKSLARAELQSRADSLVREYPGGMKRRLNFAVALMHAPKLLILDEPTVGVDPQSRSHLLDGVKQLAAEGIAVIYASHYMEEVEAVCDRVAVIDHGKMLVCDTIEGLLSEMPSEVVITLDPLEPGVGDQLMSQLPGVATLEEAGAFPELIFPDEPNNSAGSLLQRLSQVMNVLTDAKVHIRDVKTHEPNLERLFLELTGRRLRD